MYRSQNSKSGSNALWLILILSLAPAVGLGIARFAYALVLPDMRTSLSWSYSAAGFMNTINAAGYLAGAFLVPRFIKRFGTFVVVRWGTIGCVAALALCAASSNFVILSCARLLAGLGAAAGFVAGGAMAARVSQSSDKQASFLLSLFYAGPGIGICASGIVAPFVLQTSGAGSWWIVWWAMAALAAVAVLPLLLNRLETTFASVNPSAVESVPVVPIVLYLAGYFLFGAGYIAYMTFMIAYVRDMGGGAAAQAAFWTLIGLSSVASPWVFRRVLAINRGGVATAIILGVNTVGAALPILAHSAICLAVSAVIFGVSFFAVVAATTAFVRFNYPPAAWPTGIAAMTVAFGIGQTVGPVTVGAVTDTLGNLSYALNVSAILLALGTFVTALQKKTGST